MSFFSRFLNDANGTKSSKTSHLFAKKTLMVVKFIWRTKSRLVEISFQDISIRGYSGPYFPECGKIKTRITLNTDTFQAVFL